MLFVLRTGGGILGIALVTTGLQLVAGLLRIALAYRLMPELRFRPGLFGSLIPVVLLYFGVQSHALVRLLGGSRRDFLLQILRASVPVLLVMFACGEWVETFWVVDSWASLAAKSARVGAAGLVVGWFVVMDRGERLRVRSRLGLLPG